MFQYMYHICTKLKWWEVTLYLLCRSYCVNIQTNVFWIVCAVSFLLDPAYKYANYIPSYTCLIWVCKMRTLFYTLNKEGKGLKKIVLKYVQQKIYLFFLSPWACGILVPRPGIKPTSPALQGGFLSTRPPEKSWGFPFKSSRIWQEYWAPVKSRGLVGMLLMMQI